MGYTSPIMSFFTQTRLQIFLLTVARLIINTSLRMVYPFMPEIARGLNQPLRQIEQLVALRSLSGLFSPLFGPWSERVGRRTVMVWSLLLFVVAGLLAWFWPTLWGVGLALLGVGFVKIIFDPAMQGHIGDVIPYEKRGQALAFTEVAWSGGMLIGVPLVGYLIMLRGWLAPFLWLSVLGAVMMVVVWRFLPAHEAEEGNAMSFGHMLHLLRTEPILWWIAGFVFMISVGHELFLIKYGEWMESNFALNISALGLASGVIGLSELVGEGLVGWSVDRFGKRRVVLLSGVLFVVVYLSMPFVTTLTAALVTLALFFMLFELTYVGSLPLFTEALPQARSIVMAQVIGSMSLGRALGGWLGPLIWEWGGVWANSWVAATFSAVGILVFWWTIKE